MFMAPGGIACIWLAFWFYVVYDTPEVHPRISTSEKEFIEASIGDRYLEDVSVTKVLFSGIPKKVFKTVKAIFPLSGTLVPVCKL